MSVAYSEWFDVTTDAADPAEISIVKVTSGKTATTITATWMVDPVECQGKLMVYDAAGDNLIQQSGASGATDSGGYGASSVVGLTPDTTYRCKLAVSDTGFM